MDRDDRLRDQKGKGKGKGKADPKGKGPMQRPETPDEAPSGPVTVSGLPPAASRAVKAVIGERIMDLMVKQKKMQDALDRGLDPEALEQEEEERKREAEAKARVEKRMKENEAKDKANKEKVCMAMYRSPPACAHSATPPRGVWQVLVDCVGDWLRCARAVCTALDESYVFGICTTQHREEEEGPTSTHIHSPGRAHTHTQGGGARKGRQQCRGQQSNATDRLNPKSRNCDANRETEAASVLLAAIFVCVGVCLSVCLCTCVLA